MATTIPAFPASHLDYPETDGKPMAETDVHRDAMADTIAILKEFYRTAPDVYVAGNLLLYYEEGNRAASVAPDVFVVFGVPNGRRRTYKLWEEGQPPTVVFEFTSGSTRLEDLGTKRYLYASLGVREYFLCDPLAEYLKPPLQGYTLVDGEYIRLADDLDGSLLSHELGMRLRREGARLRLTRATTGERLLWPDEVAAQARAAEDRAAAAEAENAQLRAELTLLRGGSASDDA